MERSLEEAIEALDRFDDALRYNPGDDAALENRRQVQHFLEMFASQPPPQPEQEPDQDEGDENGEAQPDPEPQPGSGEEDGEQPSPSDPGDMDEEQQEGSGQPEPQEGEGEPGEGESRPDEADPDAQDEADAQAGDDRGELERPEEMTPEEAERYLNLLDERNNLVLRRGRGASRPDPPKTW